MLKDNIKELRKRNGLTQKDLAAKVGKTQQAVAKWEKGVAEPDLDTLVRIAQALNSTLPDLVRLSPLPKKGNLGTNDVQEYWATDSYLQKLGFTWSFVDSDDDEDILIGVNKDGTPEYQHISKNMELKDERTGKRYIIPVSEWNAIQNRILKYSKFEIGEYLATKEPEKE